MLQATWAVLGGDRLETAFMVRSSSSNVALELMIVNPPGWISEARDMVVPPRAACLVGKCRTIFSVRLWWLIIGKLREIILWSAQWSFACAVIGFTRC